MQLQAILFYMIAALSLTACMTREPLSTDIPMQLTTTSTTTELGSNPIEASKTMNTERTSFEMGSSVLQDLTPIPSALHKTGQIPDETSESNHEIASQSPQAIDLGKGSTTPQLELALLDGEYLRLSDLKGKVVVLNFWASWCPPCRWEMPAFEQVWREYKNQDVMFVGIAVSDAEEDARAFVDTAGVSYPIGLDTTGEFTRNYRVKTLPTTILIDRAGTETRKMSNVANETVLKLFLKRLIENGT